MSNFQIIAELCSINALQSKIIQEQAAALAQVGAAVAEEEQAEAAARLNALFGAEEE